MKRLLNGLTAVALALVLLTACQDNNGDEEYSPKMVGCDYVVTANVNQEMLDIADLTLEIAYLDKKGDRKKESVVLKDTSFTKTYSSTEGGYRLHAKQKADFVPSDSLENDIDISIRSYFEGVYKNNSHSAFKGGTSELHVKGFQSPHLADFLETIERLMSGAWRLVEDDNGWGKVVALEDYWKEEE